MTTEEQLKALQIKVALRKVRVNWQFGVITSEELDDLERRIKAGDKKLLAHYGK